MTDLSDFEGSEVPAATPPGPWIGDVATGDLEFDALWNAATDDMGRVANANAAGRRELFMRSDAPPAADVLRWVNSTVASLDACRLLRSGAQSEAERAQAVEVVRTVQAECQRIRAAWVVADIDAANAVQAKDDQPIGNKIADALPDFPKLPSAGTIGAGLGVAVLVVIAGLVLFSKGKRAVLA